MLPKRSRLLVCCVSIIFGGSRISPTPEPYSRILSQQEKQGNVELHEPFGLSGAGASAKQPGRARRRLHAIPGWGSVRLRKVLCECEAFHKREGGFLYAAQNFELGSQTQRRSGVKAPRGLSTPGISDAQYVFPRYE
jgi:hypothetical protein